MSTPYGSRDWRVYRGVGEPHDGIDRLPAPPPWRAPQGAWPDPPTRSRGAVYQVTPEIVETVNAALYLRRPLLVTGRPGSGKSSLAYHVAHELDLGQVLAWPVTSRSTLRDGLYTYDAIGRLQDASLRAGSSVPRPIPDADSRYASAPPDPSAPSAPDIGRYLRLGPLGTALLPRSQPRVLLIDEIDKSDPDLPNDLLNVFEEGQFEIPELARLDQPEARVEVYDNGPSARIRQGRVHSDAFPFTVLTSNGEREFPPAFLRRCLRLDLPQPSGDQLLRIVEAHLGREAVTRGAELIEAFSERRDRVQLSTDQLLNAIFLLLNGASAERRERLLDTVLRPLDQGF
ncbi:AAA family ATPase [Streptomyces sp. SID1121]|uniref:AAA family ATPase n=1 Tax=Streptomyces sp. SID1121 TaxID=3425888 RepID=UPI00405681A3